MAWLSVSVEFDLTLIVLTLLFSCEAERVWLLVMVPSPIWI